MRILIENAEEVAYLTAEGQWTREPGEGFGFSSTRSAFAAAKRQPVGKFNIVQFFALNGQIINLDHGRGTRQEARPVSKPQLPASPAAIGARTTAVAAPVAVL